MADAPEATAAPDRIGGFGGFGGRRLPEDRPAVHACCPSAPHDSGPDHRSGGPASLPRRARKAAALTRFWQAVEQNCRPALREVST